MQSSTRFILLCAYLVLPVPAARVKAAKSHRVASDAVQGIRYGNPAATRAVLKEAWPLPYDPTDPDFETAWSTFEKSEVAFGAGAGLFKQGVGQNPWLQGKKKALYIQGAGTFPALAVYWSSNAGYLMPAIVIDANKNGPNFLVMAVEGGQLADRSGVAGLSLRNLEDLSRLTEQQASSLGAQPEAPRLSGRGGPGRPMHSRPAEPVPAEPVVKISPEEVNSPDIFRSTVAKAFTEGMPHAGIVREWFTRKDKGIATYVSTNGEWFNGKQYQVRYTTAMRNVGIEKGWIVEHAFKPENVSTGAVTFDDLGGGSSVVNGLLDHFQADKVAFTFALTDRKSVV